MFNFVMYMYIYMYMYMYIIYTIHVQACLMCTFVYKHVLYMYTCIFVYVHFDYMYMHMYIICTHVHVVKMYSICLYTSNKLVHVQCTSIGMLVKGSCIAVCIHVYTSSICTASCIPCPFILPPAPSDIDVANILSQFEGVFSGE